MDGFDDGGFGFETDGLGGDFGNDFGFEIGNLGSDYNALLQAIQNSGSLSIFADSAGLLHSAFGGYDGDEVVTPIYTII